MKHIINYCHHMMKWSFNYYEYQVIVLDLDGTLTNSKKEITPPTRDALIEIQQNGKKVVRASGRPINGVAPLAEELYLKEIRRIHALL